MCSKRQEKVFSGSFVWSISVPIIWCTEKTSQKKTNTAYHSKIPNNNTRDPVPTEMPQQNQDSNTINLLQMNDILFYIIFSGHTDFVLALVRDMIQNVSQQYHTFKGLAPVLTKTMQLVDSGVISHNDSVVLFFFLLSVDSKMRHWILGAYEPPELSTKRDTSLRSCITLVPNGSNALPQSLSCPFLGQSVSLNSLQPHRAVSILTTLANESFFMGDNEETNSIESIHEKIKRLVLFA